MAKSERLPRRCRGPLGLKDQFRLATRRSALDSRTEADALIKRTSFQRAFVLGRRDANV